MKILAGLISVLVLTLASLGQDSFKPTTREFVEVPRDVILQVVAVQPDCPVKIENIRFLAALAGGFTNSYELRNVGPKPIRSVTVASSNGAVNTYSRDSGLLTMPGEMVPTHADSVVCRTTCAVDKVLWLTEDLRRKLNLLPPMKSVITLMVVEIEFSDGTRFNDRKTYDALATFVEGLDNARPQKATLRKE